MTARRSRSTRCRSGARRRSSGSWGCKPRRILEIGVGSGLLLGPLAAASEEYRGTDISAPVIAKLEAELASMPELAGRVRLECRPADDTEGLPRGWFDTVVINSVAQYFPDVEHLLRVIAGALELLSADGRLFLGDLRDRRLLRCLRTAIALTGDGDDAAELRRAAERSERSERELLVDPELFADLARFVPAAGACDVRLKRGRAHNELTRHRYDVVVERAGGGGAGRPAATRPVTRAGGGGGAARPAVARSVTWAGADALTAVLAGVPGPLLVTGIPDARLSGELAAMDALEAGASAASARELLAGREGVEPEDLHALAQAAQLEVVCRPSPVPGVFDAVFAAPGTPPPAFGAAPVGDAALAAPGTAPPPFGPHPRATPRSRPPARGRPRLPAPQRRTPTTRHPSAPPRRCRPACATRSRPGCRTTWSRPRSSSSTACR